MSFVIIPNDLRDQIYAAIDAQLQFVPEAKPDREHFYQTLLNHYNEFGVIPEFSLEKK